MGSRRLLFVLGWAAVLVAVAVLSARAGTGPLAPPDLNPRTWMAWSDGRAPVEAAFALLLLAARAVAWYLLAATAVSVLAELSGRRWLRRVASRVTAPVVERLLVGALGLVVVGAGPGADSPRWPMALVASAEPVHPATEPPVMHRLTVAPDQAPAPPAPPEWEVAAGDHLWSVAERVLHEAWGRAPSDREVSPYWSDLVEDNRPRLADPANPDLVFPGQRLTLPATPPAPGTVPAHG